MVSVRQDGKILFYLPTQRYDVPSVRVGKSFVLTLVAELDGLQGRKWNSENVIVFQIIILQHVWLVTGAKIFVCELMLKSTHETAERLIKLYVTPTPRLREAWVGLSGIKVLISITVCSWTLFYVVNCVRLSDSFVNMSRGEVYHPTKCRFYKTVIMEETAVTVLEKEHPHKKPSLLFYHGGVRRRAYIYSRGY